MKELIHNDFLLQSEAAKRLYHIYAAHLPIVDYHNHLPAKEINENKQFCNLTEIWLMGDHYKWRAMRAAGINEKYITGDTSDKDKFLSWAKTVPLTLKNPLYHWTHLELKRYFGIDRLLNAETAEEIWYEANASLQTPGFSTRSLLQKMNVHIICTTDDAIDSLEHHQAINNKLDYEHNFVMYPTFRPDLAMKVDDPGSFRAYVLKLEKASDIHITTFDTFLQALRNRHDYFDSIGCRASDHGVEEPYAEDYTESEINMIFDQIFGGKRISNADFRKFNSAMMHEFAVMDYEKGWAFQLHFGAIRSINTQKDRDLGPGTGFDSIGDFLIARPLARFLDRLDVNRQLPKTILYNLNPSDNALISTMIGNFMCNSIPGKVQHGPAWWFHDQKEGIEEHLQILSNMSLLSQFIGMVTDSRSFLSFPRHEYFRRILCNILGSDIEHGLIPDDYDLIGDLVRKLCYQNAIQYFEYAHTP